MPTPQKYRDVVKFLKSQGWVLLRQGRGSAELWGLEDESVKESMSPRMPRCPREWSGN